MVINACIGWAYTPLGVGAMLDVATVLVRSLIPPWVAETEDLWIGCAEVHRDGGHLGNLVSPLSPLNDSLCDTATAITNF